MATVSPDQLKFHHLDRRSADYKQFLVDYTLNPTNGAYSHDHAKAVLGFPAKDLQTIHKAHPILIPNLVAKVGGENAARANAAINGVPDQLKASDLTTNHHLASEALNPSSRHFSPLHAQQVANLNAADLEAIHSAQLHPDLLPRLRDHFTPAQAPNIVQAIHCADAAHPKAGLNKATTEEIKARSAALQQHRVLNMRPTIEQLRNLISDFGKETQNSTSTVTQLLQWVGAAETKWNSVLSSDHELHPIERLVCIEPLVDLDAALKGYRATEVKGFRLQLPEFTARFQPYQALIIQMRKLIKYWLGAFQRAMGQVKPFNAATEGTPLACNAANGIAALMQCCHQANRLNFHNSKIGLALRVGPFLAQKFPMNPVNGLPGASTEMEYWNKEELSKCRNQVETLITAGKEIAYAFKQMPRLVESDDGGHNWPTKIANALANLAKTDNAIFEAQSRLMKRSTPQAYASG